MLHLISFSVAKPYGPEKGDVIKFFELLPYVLPCKYCRANLVDHMELERLAASATAAALPKWLWTIHNLANKKLRQQKIPTATDPPFEMVAKVYNERLDLGCTRTFFEGWEFLFSIAEAHPLAAASRVAEPLPGAPNAALLEDASDLEKARWNVLEPEVRMKYYEAFLRLLPSVLPFPEWRAAAAAGCGGPADWSSRAATLKSLWGMRCSMESKLELLNTTTYAGLCKELKLNRSGCGAGRRGKTCRRKK